MRMLRELGERVESAVLEGVGRTASRYQERRSVPVDLLESDDAFLAVFDAPGATAEDVEVRFDDDVLSVTIDRFRDFYDDFEMKVPGRGLTLRGRVELPHGASVNARAAEATVTKHGALHVRVPKIENDPDRDEPIRVDTSDDDGPDVTPDTENVPDPDEDAGPDTAGTDTDADSGTNIDITDHDEE